MSNRGVTHVVENTAAVGLISLPDRGPRPLNAPGQARTSALGVRSCPLMDRLPAAGRTMSVLVAFCG